MKRGDLEKGKDDTDDTSGTEAAVSDSGLGGGKSATKSSGGIGAPAAAASKHKMGLRHSGPHLNWLFLDGWSPLFPADASEPSRAN